MPEKDIMDYVWQLARAARRGRKNKNEGISRGAFRLMRILDKEGSLRAGELAERLDIRTASLTGQLDKLEEAGLLQRSRDPADLRAVRIQLTGRGREELESLRLRRREEREKAEEILSPGEKEAFISACGKLIAFLEEES